MPAYDPEYSDEALAAFLNLPKRTALKVHAICAKLAADPLARSEPCGLDHTGRPVLHALIDGVGIRFWIDDAVRRIAIIKIVVPRPRR